MKHLMIENNGEVDVLAFTLLGASTKRADSGKIGFFGSGNKYAIANLVRREIWFNIFSGVNPIKVSTKPVKFRDDEFKQIIFNYDSVDFPTSITADMGPKWEPWYILRELYCNAIDEGGCRVEICDENDMKEEPKGEPGKTRIYIELVDELLDVVNHWNGYFTSTRVDLIETVKEDNDSLFDTIPELKIYHKYDDKLRIYRKGVLVHVSDDKSIFDYDLPCADINEERILSNMYTARYKIGCAISARGTSALLTRLLKGMDKMHRHSFPYFEAQVEYATYLNRNKEAWAKAVDGLTVINNDRRDTYGEESKAGNSLMISSSLAYSISDVSTGKVLGVPAKGLKHSFRAYIPTMEERGVIDKAYEFLVSAGWSFGDLTIDTVTFDDYAIAGMADHGAQKILLGQVCFDKGLKFTVSTLMEEHAHMVSRFSDETRAFQDYLIDGWLTEIEKRLEIRL